MLTAALNWGTIPGWGTVIVLVVGIAYLSRVAYRSRAGDALEILERANRVLSEENRRLTAEVAALSATHTLEPVLTALKSLEDAQAKAWAEALPLLAKINANLAAHNGHE